MPTEFLATGRYIHWKPCLMLLFRFTEGSLPRFANFRTLQRETLLRAQFCERHFASAHTLRATFVLWGGARNASCSKAQPDLFGLIRLLTYRAEARWQGSSQLNKWWSSLMLQDSCGFMCNLSILVVPRPHLLIAVRRLKRTIRGYLARLKAILNITWVWGCVTCTACDVVSRPTLPVVCVSAIVTVGCLDVVQFMD